MKYSDIKNLRETEKTEILKLYFLKLIANHSKIISLKEKEEHAEILCELSNKQWHNYEWFDLEKIDLKLQRSLDEYVCTLLEGELSVDLIDLLSQTIGYLGLCKSFEMLKLIANIASNPNEIRNAVSSNVEELGSNITDPYISFR